MVELEVMEGQNIGPGLKINGKQQMRFDSSQVS